MASMNPSTETSGKPEDIPQDVLVTARKAIMAEVSPDVRWQYASGRNDHFAVVKAVARAILAECERCAVAAEKRGFELSEAAVGSDIANTIRDGDVNTAHKISGDE